MKPTLTLNGVTKDLNDWVKSIGISRQTLKKRIDAGWSDERVLATPLKKKISDDELRELELAGKLPISPNKADPEIMHILQFGNSNELLNYTG